MTLAGIREGGVYLWPMLPWCPLAWMWKQR